MKIIWTIAMLKMRESFRQTVLVVTLIVTIFLIVIAPLMPAISASAQVRLIQTVSQGAMFYGGLLIAVLLASLAISREIDLRTIYHVFAAPITRPQLIAGKFLGVLFTVAIIIAIWGTISGVYIYMLGQRWLDEKERTQIFTARRNLETKTVDYNNRKTYLEHYSYIMDVNGRLRDKAEIPELVKRLKENDDALAASRRLRKIAALNELYEKSVVYDETASAKEFRDGAELWDKWWQANRNRIYFPFSPDERLKIYDGATFTWIFDNIPEDAVRKGKVLVEIRFFFSTAQRLSGNSKDDRFPVKFTASTADGREEVQVLRVKHDKRDIFSFDGSLVVNGRLKITAEAQKGVPSVMVGRNRLQVVASPGSYAANYIKHMLIMLAQIVFFAIAALGLGSLFTFPVAFFGTLCLFLAAQLRGFSESLAVPSAVKGLYYLVYIFVPNFVKYDSTEYLAEGLSIPWPFIGYTWGGITLVKGLIIGVTCFYFFRRREVTS